MISRKSFVLSLSTFLFVSTASSLLSMNVLAQTSQPATGAKSANNIKLTADQKAKIKEIKQNADKQINEVLTPEQREKLKTAKAQKQLPDLNLTDDQKAKIKAIRTQSSTDVANVLTPEQKQQIQARKQQQK